MPLLFQKLRHKKNLKSLKCTVLNFKIKNMTFLSYFLSVLVLKTIDAQMLFRSAFLKMHEICLDGLILRIDIQHVLHVIRKG